MIHETIVTTLFADGGVHMVPLGVRYAGASVMLAPFRPSATLDNLRRDGHAVVNLTDDVRVFAGCLTGRRLWPTVAASHIPGVRLAAALAHLELQLERVEEDELRPRLFCRQLHAETHAPFRGFNRAQAAVVEACILVSRLNMLPEEKVRSEIEYLSIALGKTAGPGELEAWDWLTAKIAAHYDRGATPGATAA